MTSGVAQLRVILHNVQVGTLTRSRSGLVTFLPDPDWLDSNQRPRLGVAFLRDPSPRRAGTGLPPWFENLLPEPGSVLRQRICARLGLRESDSFALLKVLGMDLPGAVTVTNGTSSQAELPLATDDLTPGELEYDASWRFSLAGVQLKFSMALRGQKFAVPASDELGRWIVKIPPTNLPQLPRIEHWTMRWAAESGLTVAETRIVPMADVQTPGPTDLEPDAEVLAVRRFDRTDDGARIHQEDLAQALDLLPGAKYVDQGHVRVGHDAIVRLLSDVASEAVAVDYVRRLAFVIASGNTDEHLKNWSLLWPGDALRPTLTPAYDQVAIISLPGFRWHPDRATQAHPYPRLALPFGGSRDLVSLDEARLHTFAHRSSLGRAATILHEGLEAARNAWPAIAPHAPADMVEAIEEHWRRVPLLRDHGPLKS
ncbi:MAG: type II toxin-antitoxin system HipA family toxin [Deltaproteobacteria bacterium]|nr:MAG: type II toxin-antitoxin system HipA family toxin [Deltaproteobacteria bacterium]